MKGRKFFFVGLGGVVAVITMGMGEGNYNSKPLDLSGKIDSQTGREVRPYDGVFLLDSRKMQRIADGVFPRLSKDGRKVLYKREHTIYLFDLIANQTQSLDWTTQYSPFDFDISPDGRWLAFTSDHVRFSKHKVPQLNLMVARLDGSDLIQLTDVKEIVGCPRWSPNGQGILFSSPTNPMDDKEIGGLYKIHPDGSALQRLFGPDPYYALQGAWSPDGQHIALAHIDPNEKRSQIYLMNADGSNLKKLTCSPGGCGSPAFSPDGNRILFLMDRTDSSESGSNLYVIDINGVNQRRVTPPQKIKKYGRWRWATDINPDWAP